MAKMKPAFKIVVVITTVACLGLVLNYGLDYLNKAKPTEVVTQEEPKIVIKEPISQPQAPVVEQYQPKEFQSESSKVNNAGLSKLLGSTK